MADVSQNVANEQATGVRLNWNILPSSQESSISCQLPLAALVTPLNKHVPVTRLMNQEPLRAKNGMILNCYSNMNIKSKSWSDPISNSSQLLPSNYGEWVSETNTPPEMLSQVVEYTIPAQHNQAMMDPPTFLLVVDLCVYAEELDSLKLQLQKLIGLMPGDASVGLITFGTNVLVHELGCNTCNKSIVLRGEDKSDAPVTSDSIINQLGLRNPSTSPPSSRFFVNVGESGMKVDAAIEDLEVDEWPKAADCRAKRCTGMAIHVATSMMEFLKSQKLGRIMTFVGGICTSGPGAMAGLSLANNIRQHSDISNGTSEANLVQSSSRLFEGISERLIQIGIAMDIFVASLDQVGYYEMRSLVERTGGCIVMSDTFSSHMFSDSLDQMMARDDEGYLIQGFNAKISVITSPQLKICGGIGPFASIKKSSISSTGGSEINVASTKVGESDTCVWAAGSIDPNSSYAFYFDVETPKQVSQAAKYGFLQFQTSYWHSSGRRKLRVCTIAREFEQPEFCHISQGFDQEAAAVLLARLAVNKCILGEESLDVLKWVDRKLIRVASKFGDFTRNKPESFAFPNEFSLFPQYMFHLRRSPLLQTFNASPDESSFYRSIMNRENVSNSTTMLMPSLMQYSVNSEPEPVSLDVSSLKSNVVLILDTYFHVVLWFGDTVAGWMDNKYHEQPEYAHIRDFVQRPGLDATNLLKERFPVPKFVNCRAGGSQARFLLAKVNPSSTHQNRGDPTLGGVDNGCGAVVLTDDVSIEVFVDHLIKLAVST